MFPLLLQGRADEEEEDDGMTEIENWSSTHSVKTRAYLQPESIEEARIYRPSIKATSGGDCHVNP